MQMKDLSDALTALGCPPAKAAAMAAQLDKRARQLMTERHQTYDEALAHLLGLMRQGWAAQEKVEGRASSVENGSTSVGLPALDSRHSTFDTK